MVDRDPENKPKKTEKARGEEGEPPSQKDSDPGYRDRRDGPADARSAVKDPDRKAALLGGKPFRYCLAGPGPVAAFADTEEEAEKSKRTNRVCQGGQHAGDRPPDHRYGQAHPRPDHVDQHAADQPHARIGNLKGRHDA